MFTHTYIIHIYIYIYVYTYLYYTYICLYNIEYIIDTLLLLLLFCIIYSKLCDEPSLRIYNWIHPTHPPAAKTPYHASICRWLLTMNSAQGCDFQINKWLTIQNIQKQCVCECVCAYVYTCLDYRPIQYMHSVCIYIYRERERCIYIYI